MSQDLNQEQLEVIKHTDGPLLVIAGAGTGKTTAITQRVHHLVTAKLAQPGEILALTFTEKSAKEMEERIDVALPYGYTQMWVTTFHSFCDRVLRDEAINIGRSPDYKLLSTADSVSLLKRNLFKFDFNLEYYRPLGNPNKFIIALLQHFSRLKDEDITPDDYLDWIKKRNEITSSSQDSQAMENQKYTELGNLYKAFEQLKITENVMDFSDLISYTLELFRTRPNILESYQQQFKYILVDEFQDTNFAQNCLINLLAASHQNLTVVADDDQAIYRWRGAAVSNVIQFKNQYPNTKIIVLTHNYRSTQEILDSSYELIQHNNPDRLEAKEGINKKLISQRNKKGNKIELIFKPKVEDEADAVSEKIIELTKSKISYKDIAILVRANSHSEIFMKNLEKRGIPFQFLGPTSLFNRQEIKDLLALLKFLNNTNDDISLFRLLASDNLNLSGKDLAIVFSFAKKYHLSLFESCQIFLADNHAQTHPLYIVPFFPKEELSQLKIPIDLLLGLLEMVPNSSAGQILFSYIKSSGLLEKIVNLTPPIDDQKAANIMKFFNKLKSLESSQRDPSVASAIDWIELSTSVGESPQTADIDWTKADAVNILTIHSAKGLEFPVVFLVNLVSARFPSTQRQEQIPIPEELVKEVLPEGDYHLQEERRLFYVGMTRARDQLFLTAASFYGDGKREKKLSPFVLETLGPVLGTPQPNISSPSQLTLLDWDVPTEKPKQNMDPAPHFVNYLSYSQIQAFLDCPFHYKARYILKIPTPATASLSFGSSIHLALKEFYETIKGENHVLSQDKLLGIALDKLKKNWIKEGYQNQVHEQKFFEKGSKFLNQYLNTQFDPQIKVLLLEQPFTVPLTLGSKFLKIGGKIDRVNQLPNGRIEIFDYKTGANVPTQKDVDSDLQLSFYALAATSIKDPPFGKGPQDIDLTLYYFDTQSKITTARSQEVLDLAKEKIFSYADQISHSDFKCSGGLLCQNCEYRMLCDPKS